jgi:cytochrome oxidase Cu insertion factor (SCO1/SenC/PrrC family)
VGSIVHQAMTKLTQSQAAVDHSIVMYLMGPDGQFIDFFTQLMTVPEITEKIAATIVQQPEKASASISRLLGFGKRD